MAQKALSALGMLPAMRLCSVRYPFDRKKTQGWPGRRNVKSESDHSPGRQATTIHLSVTSSICQLSPASGNYLRSSARGKRTVHFSPHLFTAVVLAATPHKYPKQSTIVMYLPHRRVFASLNPVYSVSYFHYSVNLGRFSL